MYKVVLVPAACGQAALDVNLIEKNANAMLAKGYELTHIYQSSTHECTGSKSAAVMVFRKR